jgi:hypothetical protein
MTKKKQEQWKKKRRQIRNIQGNENGREGNGKGREGKIMEWKGRARTSKIKWTWKQGKENKGNNIYRNLMTNTGRDGMESQGTERMPCNARQRKARAAKEPQ